MEALIKRGTQETPEIIFDPQKDEFSISGNSLPEDVIAFYDEVNQWLEKYVKSPNPVTHLHVRMTYYNSASSKAMSTIMGLFEKTQNTGGKTYVHWHYLDDDEDMLDAGKELEGIFNLTFQFLPYLRNN